MSSVPSSNPAFTVHELADRAAISDVINRYGEGIRVRDIDLLASCFADDATLDYGHDQTTGIDDIRRFFAGGSGPGRSAPGSVLALDERVASTPVMTNILIDLAGDEAHCESMCLAIHCGFVEGEGSVIVRGTRNVDDLVRTPAGWRIRHRIHATVWSFQVPGTPVVE
jgi:hypothetical protein